MELYNYIIITLLLIVTIFVTREITIYFYKKPFLPTEILGPTISFDDNFRSMFENPSPWPGLNQTIFGRKGESVVESKDS